MLTSVNEYISSTKLNSTWLFFYIIDNQQYTIKISGN